MDCRVCNAHIRSPGHLFRSWLLILPLFEQRRSGRGGLRPCILKRACRRLPGTSGGAAVLSVDWSGGRGSNWLGGAAGAVSPAGPDQAGALAARYAASANASRRAWRQSCSLHQSRRGLLPGVDVKVRSFAPGAYGFTGGNKKPARMAGFFALRRWWARWDLNPGPKDYESSALTN